MLGRCRLTKLIGSGSMGVVYEAYHTTLSMPVAVKVLNPMLASPDATEWRERLRREAQLAARLNHPGLVRVLDYGEESDSPYLVMEFIQGQTLEALLQKRDPVGENLALRILGQIATALHVAHQAGIVHRDLKPANILIESTGKLKVADLGLARDQHGAAITRPSGITGTPHYMAPETLDNSVEPDHRVDLYAMGVLLYRMLFCRLPYTGNIHQVLAGHIGGSPDWTIPDGSRISPGSLYLTRRLLEKWPAKRLQTAVEVVQGCRELLGRLDAQERLRAERLVQQAASPSGSSASRLGRVVREKLRSQTALKSGITIVHATSRERFLAWLLLVIVAFVVLRGFFSPSPTPEGTIPSVQTGR